MIFFRAGRFGCGRAGDGQREERPEDRGVRPDHRGHMRFVHHADGAHGSDTCRADRVQAADQGQADARQRAVEARAPTVHSGYNAQQRGRGQRGRERVQPTGGRARPEQCCVGCCGGDGGGGRTNSKREDLRRRNGAARETINENRTSSSRTTTIHARLNLANERQDKRPLVHSDILLCITNVYNTRQQLLITFFFFFHCLYSLSCTLYTVFDSD